jgi:hypothetical protein
MKKDNEIMPGVEPLRSDWFIEKLGQTQQKLMSLTVRCRRLEISEQKARERAEVLEELVMDVAADLRDGVKDSEIDYRIGKVMQRLENDA